MFAVRLNSVKEETIGVDADRYDTNRSTGRDVIVDFYKNNGEKEKTVASFINPVFVVLQDQTPTTPIQENVISGTAPDANKE